MIRLGRGGTWHLYAQPVRRTSHQVCQRQIISCCYFLKSEKKTEPRRDYQAICVLGGGNNPDGSLPARVIWRLDLSHRIFEKQKDDCYLLCTGAGTPHKPPVLDDCGFVLHESTLMAKNLVRRGIPSKRILKEVVSYDTVGNAYFTLMTHVLPAGWTRLAIITSKFHMPRVRAIMTDVFHLADPKKFTLDFFVSPDDDLPPAALAARKTREAESLREWNKNYAGISTLSELHEFLFLTHRCYAVSRQDEFSLTNLTPLEKDSY